MRRTIMAALACTLAACSGGDDDGDSEAASTSTTERPTTTTTAPPSPDEAFLDDIGRELEFGDAEGPEAMLGLARAACEALDSAGGLVAGDAPADSPGSDAAISEVTVAAALATAFSGDLDDRAVAVVLTVGAEHLCPEHAGVIAGYIADEGIDMP